MGAGGPLKTCGRYYDPYQPRFMTADWAEKPEAVPYSDLADPQSLNLYAYVRNNPVSRTDPGGHCGGSDVPCPIPNAGSNPGAQQVAQGTGEVGFGIAVLVGIMQPEVGVGEIIAGALTSSSSIVAGTADVFSGASHQGSTSELKEGMSFAQNPTKIAIAAVNGGNTKQANGIGDVVQGASAVRTLATNGHASVATVVSAAKDAYDGIKAAFSLALSARTTYRNLKTLPPTPTPPSPPVVQGQDIETKPGTKVHCPLCG